MKKTRTTFYISDEIYQKLVTLVHNEKLKGNRGESHSSIIAKAVELYDKNEKAKDKIRSAFLQEDIDNFSDKLKSDYFEKTGNLW
jgi:DNA-binding ferritin-like protein (Dps family)